MGNFINRNLNQTAVYWAAPTNNGYGGFTWATPVNIDCRWESSSRVITLNDGKQLVPYAAVFSGQDLTEQGMLYLGDVKDLSAGEKSNPLTLSGAYQIKRFDKSPSLNGQNFSRVAYLAPQSKTGQR